MTLMTAIALFGAMFVLALVPGPGVFVVVARSMASGFRHGLYTVLGIVFGDYVFILLAVLGLVALADAMGSFFVILKYAGAAYLIWMAISLWKASNAIGEAENNHAVDGIGVHNKEGAAASAKNTKLHIKESSSVSDFLAGFITTLGNPKAILFYVGFFPAFLDLATVSVLDVVLIMSIVTVSVGGVMLGYAYTAAKAGKVLSSPRAQKRVNRTASGVMACSGVLLAVKA